MERKNENQVLSYGKSVALILIAMVIIIVGKQIYNLNTAMVLFIDAAILSFLCYLWGTPWKEIQDQIERNMATMTVPILILLAVGMLVGSWMISGTLPTMIYYGMTYINPSFFLIFVCLVSALMSLMTGTSWGTVSTVGVAFVGVSVGLEIPLPYTAGAIVTGAIFGDKLSPLSDTTVMASAVCDVDIMDHIRHLLYTTVPGLLISLVLYGFLGINHSSGLLGGENYDLLLHSLSTTFFIHPVLLIPPFLVLLLIALNKPTLPTFAVGILAGLLCSMIFQNTSMEAAVTSLVNGYKSSTGIKVFDSMVNRGGFNSMVGTVVLVISSGVFGAPLQSSGAIKIVIDKLVTKLRNGVQMMLLCTISHCILFLMVVSYYVSFVMMGNIAKDLYDKFDLHRKNLSRTLEDTGTALAPLIPWGLSGAFYSGTLGVAVGDYALYTPICYLSVFIGIFYILTGFGIAKSDGTMVRSLLPSNKEK